MSDPRDLTESESEVREVLSLVRGDRNIPLLDAISEVHGAAAVMSGISSVPFFCANVDRTLATLDAARAKLATAENALDEMRINRDEWMISAKEIPALRAEVARLREALEYADDLCRGLAEHGVTVVVESEEAEGQPWVKDAAFITKTKEIWRVMGNAIADAIAKRAALAAKEGE